MIEVLYENNYQRESVVCEALEPHDNRKEDGVIFAPVNIRVISSSDKTYYNLIGVNLYHLIPAENIKKIREYSGRCEFDWSHLQYDYNPIDIAKRYEHLRHVSTKREVVFYGIELSDKFVKFSTCFRVLLEWTETYCGNMDRARLEEDHFITSSKLFKFDKNQVLERFAEILESRGPKYRGNLDDFIEYNISKIKDFAPQRSFLNYSEYCKISEFMSELFENWEDVLNKYLEEYKEDKQDYIIKNPDVFYAIYNAFVDKFRHACFSVTCTTNIVSEGIENE